jgi:hypothetical protein
LPSATGREKTGWGREGLLVVASLAAGFLALELCFRVGAYLRHRKAFERAMNDPPPIGPDRRATLGNLLRPSRRPRIVYELRPRLSARMVIPDGPEQWVHTSSQGFRDREYALAADPHPSALSHEIAAGCLLEWMRNEGMTGR